MKFVPAILYVLSWIFTYIIRHHYQYFSEALFLSTLLIAVGIREIYSFYCNALVSKQSAQTQLRPPSDYQRDLSFVNFGIGVTAIFSYFNPIFSFGVALVAVLFFLGLSIGHLLDLRNNKDANIKNIAPLLASDLLTGCTLMYCFWHMHNITKIL